MDLPLNDALSTRFKQNFESELQKYEDQHQGSQKRPWTKEKVIEVINYVRQARMAMASKKRRTSMEYYWMSKYDVMTIEDEEHLIFKKKATTDPTILIIPRDEYFDILKETHESCGHGGRDKILRAVKTKFYIPKKAVEVFVALCPGCENRKNNLTKDKTDLITRVAISPEQMEGLLEFIEQNPALARGKTKPLHLSQKLWTQCAKKLNTYKDGAKKNGKQWAKSWTDIKYRVRRRALELQAAKAEDKTLSRELLPLSTTEERILSVIGKDSIDEVVIKHDPLTLDTDLLSDDDDLLQNDDYFVAVDVQSTTSRSDNFDLVEDSNAPFPTTQRIEPTIKKRRQLSTQEASDDCASLPEKKPRLKIDVSDNAESASEDNASVFFEMERKKIDNVERLTNAVCDIKDQMNRLIEVFVEIRDAIISKNKQS